jgi:hypothetical protein
MRSGTASNLNGVWGSSGSDVFAVGGYYDNSGHHHTILHHDRTLTPQTLIEFNTIPGNRMVTLTWSTASEIDNAGFNLYRSPAENGEYIKINNPLIPAHGSATHSASYKFVDKNMKNRKTYYYKLEDIDLSGTSTMHGPVSATPRWMFRVLK